MALVNIAQGYKNSAWFTANPTIVLLAGQRVNLEQTGLYKLGDGVTSLSALSFLGAVPTKTSELTNDGDDGNPFISLNDLPSNIILYPTNVPSAIPTYFKAVSSIVDPDYNVTAVDISTGTITTTAQLIASLSAPIGLIIGNPGIFNITTIGNIKRVSGTGTATFYFEVYKRTSGGVETLIGTSSNTLAPTLSTYVEFSATAIWNDGIFAPTDLPVIKLYANRVGAGTNPVYNFQFGGTTPVRTLVPVPLSVTSSISQTITNGVVDKSPSENVVFNALATKGDVTLTGTQTLTNKTVKKRILVVTQSATPATNIDNGDIVQITALAQAITSMTSGLTGTPYDGQMIMWQITDNGTARAITWGASFSGSMPTTTVISTMLRTLTQYNSTTGKHEFLATI